VDLFSRSGSRIGHTLVCTVGFLQNHYVYVGSYGIVLGAFLAFAAEMTQVWAFRCMGIFGTQYLLVGELSIGSVWVVCRRKNVCCNWPAIPPAFRAPRGLPHPAFCGGVQAGRASHVVNSLLCFFVCVAT
jgi:hypothetical protein